MADRSPVVVGRCIIATGLPLIPRRARSPLSRQVESFVERLLLDIQEVSGDETPSSNNRSGERTSPSFRVEIKVNSHSRLEEPIRILFGERISTDDVVSLCSVLQEHSASNPFTIVLPSDEEQRDERNERQMSFVPVFSLGAGAIRDHAFSTWPWKFRRKIQCDGVGVFSLTSDRAATRMAKLLRCFHVPSSKDVWVVDGMAGVGGNTMGFLRYWDSVAALEVDPSRFSMLKANVDLWYQWNPTFAESRNTHLQNNCLIEHLGSFANEKIKANKSSRLLFLDPPWGGAQFKEKLHEQGGDIVVPPTVVPDGNAAAKCCDNHLVDRNSHWRFSDLVCQILQSQSFRVVASKLPLQFEDTLLIDPLVHREGDSRKERTHPFRFRFGASCKLLVLVKNNGDDRAFANGPEGLDRMIERIMEWQNSMDLQGDGGCREHRPEFYDWEKRRWIMLKKWKGSQVSTA